MNPNMVAQNRTARLVREASTPVYTTETPEREHIIAVEVEAEDGYRMWIHGTDAEVQAEFESLVAIGYGLSDEDHSAKCWCQ